MLGGRWVLSTVSIRVFNPAHLGIDFSCWKFYQKRHLLPYSPCRQPAHTLPMDPGYQRKNVRFSSPLKGGPLYRIPSRTVAHHRACCCLRGNVAAIPTRQVGMLPAWCWTFALNLPVALNPLKTTPPLAVPSPGWAFCVWGPRKTESRNEQRAGKRFSGSRGAVLDRRAGT